mmetsp:Transcript_4217/g.8677  ORF Transcript_4217/g.8677 Transcript_4217/m.8677 type:complete len:229 (-) Transcript_4217:1313-1999(-)
MPHTVRSLHKLCTADPPDGTLLWSAQGEARCPQFATCQFHQPADLPHMQAEPIAEPGHFRESTRPEGENQDAPAFGAQPCLSDSAPRVASIACFSPWKTPMAAESAHRLPAAAARCVSPWRRWPTRASPLHKPDLGSLCRGSAPPTLRRAGRRPGAWHGWLLTMRPPRSLPRPPVLSPATRIAAPSYPRAARAAAASGPPECRAADAALPLCANHLHLGRTHDQDRNA